MPRSWWRRRPRRPPGATGRACVWHFLGAVQRNKVAQLAPLVGVWQSVARVAEGERIARFAPRARVLVQVETTGLPGRNGCPPAAAAEPGGGAARSSGSTCGAS